MWLWSIRICDRLMVKGRWGVLWVVEDAKRVSKACNRKLKSCDEAQDTI
jgi:hypothetical protein